MMTKIKNAHCFFDQEIGGWTVSCDDAEGRQYYRTDLKLSMCIASGLARKINERGTINADLWQCHVPYGSVAWELEGHEQRQIEDERYGYC